MPKTLGEYERIKRLHAAGDHSRCQFGCCSDNPDPTLPPTYQFGGHSGKEISKSITEQTAGIFGCEDPRYHMVRMAADIASKIPDQDVEDDKWMFVAEILQSALADPGGRADKLDEIRLNSFIRRANKLN